MFDEMPLAESSLQNRPDLDMEMSDLTILESPNPSPATENPTISPPPPPSDSANVSLVQNTTASESPPVSSPPIDPIPQSPPPLIPPPIAQSPPPPVPENPVATIPVPVPPSQPISRPPPPISPPPPVPLIPDSPIQVHETPPSPLNPSPIATSSPPPPPSTPAQQVVQVPVFVPVFVPTLHPPSISLPPPIISNPVTTATPAPPVRSAKPPPVPSSQSQTLQPAQSPTVPASVLSGMVPEPRVVHKAGMIGIGVGFGVLGIFLMFGAICFFLNCKKKRHRTAHFPGKYCVAQNSPTIAAVVPDNCYQMGTISYQQLCDITEGFSVTNLLGEGGFARVYKGIMRDTGREVAVKQIKIEKNKGTQGERDFRMELEIIGRIHHRHLVELLGYCLTDKHRLLVYEYVPNQTLDHHLHGAISILNWPNRMKIAIGSARGLAYLHEDCQPKIIHRDIKSANILLDNSFEAKVADFGLAKFTNDTYTHVSTRVVGTFGYMAPEYAASGKLTDKSDVFSFGVMLLELITGRKPVNPLDPDESLVEWARPLLIDALETQTFDRLVDPKLEGNYERGEMHQMIHAAAACVRHSAAKRPRMLQVMRALDRGARMSDLSNGVKIGESTIYDSRQYSLEIERLHNIPFPGDA